ncbi:MAG: DUF1553 domain-containing protein [Planctomycetota bacterium]
MRFLIRLVLVLVGLCGPVFGADEPTAEQAEFFRSKVLPLLETRCFECHGNQDDIEGDLRLTTLKDMLTGGESGAAVVPGDPDRSLIVQAVRYETFQMPPRDKLPDQEIEILVKWIRDGARWPKEESSPPPAAGRPSKSAFPLQERKAAHWAWRPLEQPAVPSVQNVSWPSTDVDRFILQPLEAVRLTPAPDAARTAILRRLSFDILGLPPSLQLQDQFLADPRPLPEAVAAVADQLLASPQFGERWGRHWLDLVRYAETLGHEFDFPLPHAWQYRDYVIRALNADVPYNEFVREHIAGDLLAEPRRHPERGTNESIIATGFWYLCEDKHAPVDVRLEEAFRIDNQIDMFGKAFLGLTIACARCHDHKFDAISTEDYYALAGFLQSSRRRIEWLDPGQQQEQRLAEIRRHQQAADATLSSGLQTWTPELLKQLVLAALDDAIPLSGPATTAHRDAFRTALAAPDSLLPSSPLAPIATLAKARAAGDRAAAIAAWQAAILQRLQRNQPPAPESPSAWQVLADLRAGVPDGWFVWGQAFDGLVPSPVTHPAPLANEKTPGSPGAALPASLPRGPAGPPNATPPAINRQSATQARWTWRQDECVPGSGDAVNSAMHGPAFRGALHSPEWELQHPEVLILAAGRQARVRLVVDGYVMNEFTELLFGGLRQSIDTDGQFRWIRIAGDLRRYLGHRCHLEFLDEGDGWFAIREVRLVHPGQSFDVPEEVHPVNRQLAAVPAGDDFLKLWASTVQSGAAWPQLARQLGLLPADAQTSLTQQLTAWQQLAPQPVPGDPVLVMCEGSGEDERIFVRGNHRNLGPFARRRLLTALDQAAPLATSSGSGRLELADRLLADDNPFPARVAVNRVWQQLFGRGIVASADNFGVLGEAPSHPALLDHLATDFRRDGWSLKRLIRRLVTSRVYLMSSQRNPDASERDPANILLHRANVRRLESEAIRDSILAISGRLDPAMFGPPVPVYLTPFMQGRGRPGASGPVDGAGRRSIYQAVNRNFLNPFMLTFDTPQPASAVARRSRSNVPAQALIMLNSEFLHGQADVWALKLAEQPPEVDRLNLAWRQAFGRTPEAADRQAVTAWLSQLAEERKVASEELMKDKTILTELCHALLNKKELLYLE